MSIDIYQPATKDTFFLRQAIWLTFSQNELSFSMTDYADTRWYLYDELLKSCCASQLLMKLSIYQANFQLIDYFVVFAGFACCDCANLQVILDVIDKQSAFDNVVTNPKMIKMLLKASNSRYVGNPSAIKCIIAHILTKFPELKKMNFMFIKAKSKAPAPRFAEEDIHKFFKLP